MTSENIETLTVEVQSKFYIVLLYKSPNVRGKAERNSHKYNNIPESNCVVCV